VFFFNWSACWVLLGYLDRCSLLACPTIRVGQRPELHTRVRCVCFIVTSSLLIVTLLHCYFIVTSSLHCYIVTSSLLHLYILTLLLRYFISTSLHCYFVTSSLLHRYIVTSLLHRYSIVTFLLHRYFIPTHCYIVTSLLHRYSIVTLILHRYIVTSSLHRFFIVSKKITSNNVIHGVWLWFWPNLPVANHIPMSKVYPYDKYIPCVLSVLKMNGFASRLTLVIQQWVQ